MERPTTPEAFNAWFAEFEAWSAAHWDSHANLIANAPLYRLLRRWHVWDTWAWRLTIWAERLG